MRERECVCVCVNEWQKRKKYEKGTLIIKQEIRKETLSTGLCVFTTFIVVLYTYKVMKRYMVQDHKSLTQSAIILYGAQLIVLVANELAAQNSNYSCLLFAVAVCGMLSETLYHHQLHLCRGATPSSARGLFMCTAQQQHVLLAHSSIPCVLAVARSVLSRQQQKI